MSRARAGPARLTVDGLDFDAFFDYFLGLHSWYKKIYKPVPFTFASYKPNDSDCGRALELYFADRVAKEPVNSPAVQLILQMYPVTMTGFISGASFSYLRKQFGDAFDPWLRSMGYTELADFLKGCPMDVFIADQHPLVNQVFKARDTRQRKDARTQWELLKAELESWPIRLTVHTVHNTMMSGGRVGWRLTDGDRDPHEADDQCDERSVSSCVPVLCAACCCGERAEAVRRGEQELVRNEEDDGESAREW